MKYSNFYLYTIKQNPNDAFLASHKLMIRAGMIRQASSGIYNWLPLGLIVLKKIENIIRNLHSKYGVNEILMPTIQSSELWKKSRRYDDYGKEMLKFKDRNENELLYGPTNEEQITDIVSKDLKSYKDFPKILYHIQWKFRDELRPRFGVMRCREFLMKDAYSFDIDYHSAYYSYCKMFVLYLQIFRDLGLQEILPYKADTGPIGGDLSHEFILKSEAGESNVFYDNRALDIDFRGVELEDKKKILNIVANFNSIYSCTKEKHNQKDFDSSVPKEFQTLSKGIEIGHIFYFGTKYSDFINASFLDKNSKNSKIHSGSYGIGVSRLVAAIIEANHDEKGIVWPIAIAPFKIALINVRQDNELSRKFCESFYDKYHKKFDIFYDDRDIRLGEKLNDIDLLGLPIQLIIGEKNIKIGKIEVKDRNSGNIELVEIEQINNFLEKKYEF